MKHKMCHLHSKDLVSLIYFICSRNTMKTEKGWGKSARSGSLGRLVVYSGGES